MFDRVYLMLDVVFKVFRTEYVNTVFKFQQKTLEYFDNSP